MSAPQCYLVLAVLLISEHSEMNSFTVSPVYIYRLNLLVKTVKGVYDYIL